MNILHLSDLHFGPRHWDGDDEALLEKINSYPADVVIDTGDTTTDGRESEYVEARKFFDKINCSHIVTVIGNHDNFFGATRCLKQFPYPLIGSLITRENDINFRKMFFQT